MFRWTPYVFVRATLFLAGGIVLGIYLPNAVLIHQISVLLVVVACVYALLWYRRTDSHGILRGAAALLFLVLTGYARLLIHTDTHDENHLIRAAGMVTHYRLVINSIVQHKAKSWRAEGRVVGTRIDSAWSERSGTVLLYFSRSEFPTPPVYGDTLLVRGSPSLLSPPANPGEFDYKTFLAHRNVFHQHFLKRKNVQFLGNGAPSRLVGYAIQIRLWAHSALYRFVEGETAQGVASALVLGDTDGLDRDVMQAYAATGALHVLAVSGLHVGIIYAILMLFLKPLKKRPEGVWLIAVISIVVLWAYAFVTGLTPSVLRAVAMFSFVALARPLRRATNIYNILGASAFWLLVFDPHMITAVGFQLSYVAVIGIVYIHPRLYAWWAAPTWWLDKVWQVTSVSIAAQLATLPLGILYFHQFPAYFLISNLIAIPLSFVALVLGLALLAASSVPMIASIIGQVLTLAIDWMNTLVAGVAQWPYSLIDGLYITTTQSWLMAGCMIMIAFLFNTRRFGYGAAAAAFALAFFAVQWSLFLKAESSEALVVYSIPGHRAIEVLAHGKSYFDAADSTRNNYPLIRSRIAPNRLSHFVTDIQPLYGQPFAAQHNGLAIVQWEQTTILVINQRPRTLPEISVDVVIVGGDALPWHELARSISFKKLVLDGSNSYYFASDMMRENPQEEIHSVLHHGAFVYQL